MRYRQAVKRRTSTWVIISAVPFYWPIHFLCALVFAYLLPKGLGIDVRWKSGNNDCANRKWVVTCTNLCSARREM
jgi:hypothetical protein